jgi:hypothetical protein
MPNFFMSELSPHPILKNDLSPQRQEDLKQDKFERNTADYREHILSIVNNPENMSPNEQDELNEILSASTTHPDHIEAILEVVREEDYFADKRRSGFRMLRMDIQNKPKPAKDLKIKKEEINGVVQILKEMLLEKNSFEASMIEKLLNDWESNPDLDLENWIQGKTNKSAKLSKESIASLPGLDINMSATAHTVLGYMMLKDLLKTAISKYRETVVTKDLENLPIEVLNRDYFNHKLSKEMFFVYLSLVKEDMDAYFHNTIRVQFNGVSIEEYNNLFQLYEKVLKEYRIAKGAKNDWSSAAKIKQEPLGDRVYFLENILFMLRTGAIDEVDKHVKFLQNKGFLSNWE